MNTIVLMGRLARDPETKLASTQKGQTKVSRFPLVVKRNRTSKAFVVMITAYGNNAEFVEKYLEKGIKIALSGELVISQIKDEQTGTASYYTEVIMDNVEFAEAKSDLQLAGVVNINENDALIIRAVTLFVKAEFNYQNAADRYRQSYEALKMSLCLAGDYNTKEG